MVVSFKINPECDGTDKDEVCDVSDNCINDPNHLQEDFDYDRLGDICDPDDDNDGVLDADDHCQFSVLPELVPTESLMPNHYADVDGDGYFESRSPKSKTLLENLKPFGETFGCSCKEILDAKPGQDEGETKFGCTGGTLTVWSQQKGWAKVGTR